MEVLNVILSSPRTLFTMQGLAMQINDKSRESLKRSLIYYVKKGAIINPRKGIYAKRNYNEQEMACALLKPAYISLEYVLSRAGVTFQYSSEITCVSYQNRTIEVDGRTYVFRQINPNIWTNMIGIEQHDNIAIATPERAFLDMLYLSAGQCYFDNLRPLNKKLIKQILPTYNSPILVKRVEKILM
ncbi:MAG: hypothetical protein K5860_06315 [Bacteroidales bacterium]|nr:hypothetical protein [Bacteroidales bacterium]MCR4800104.1 hypothetical protein [Bacteroidales bacterium]